MKFVFGVVFVVEMLKVGIVVGLGIDGEKENNNFDMFEEMKIVLLLVKFVKFDVVILDVWDVCKMVIINGVKVLGLV